MTSDPRGFLAQGMTTSLTAVMLRNEHSSMPAAARASPTQERLAAKLQLAGLDISRSSLYKIESGEQAVFDFQVLYFRRVFKADSDDLYRPFDPRTSDFHQKVARFMGTR